MTTQSSKYPFVAHIINIIFLGVLAVTPAYLCMKKTFLPQDFVNAILFITFLLTIVVLADWYHFYFTNNYKSIFFALVFGLCLAVLCFAVACFIYDGSIVDLAMFKESGWNRSGELFKGYVAGIGLFCSALISIPRLLIIKLFTQNNLPEFEKIKT